MTPIAVLGATGAIGGRFVEVVAGDGRAPVRALLHRWWRTARVVRQPVELRSIGATVEAAACALDGCGAAVSFVDGPTADATFAAALIEGCQAVGVERLVHLGCLSPDASPRDGTIAARRRTFEQTLLAAGDRTGVQVVVLEAPLVYGPFTEDGAHLPRAQVERGRVAIAESSAPCHVVYVDDVVEAMWAAATVATPTRGRIAISGPEPITWVDFYGAFEPVVGRPAVAVLPDDELAALVASDPTEQAELRWPGPRSTTERIADGVGRRVLRRSPTRPPRRRLVLPDPDQLTARATPVAVSLEPAAAQLGWAPVVDFTEGMRRTAAYLRWADPRSDDGDPTGAERRS